MLTHGWVGSWLRPSWAWMGGSLGWGQCLEAQWSRGAHAQGLKSDPNSRAALCQVQLSADSNPGP